MQFNDLIDGSTERNGGNESGGKSFIDNFNLRIKALVLMGGTKGFINVMGIVDHAYSFVVVVQNVFDDETAECKVINIPA
jgi:hypothetical protein